MFLSSGDHMQQVFSVVELSNSGRIHWGRFNIKTLSYLYYNIASRLFAMEILIPGKTDGLYIVWGLGFCCVQWSSKVIDDGVNMNSIPYREIHFYGLVWVGVGGGVRWWWWLQGCL